MFCILMNPTSWVYCWFPKFPALHEFTNPTHTGCVFGDQGSLHPWDFFHSVSNGFPVYLFQITYCPALSTLYVCPICPSQRRVYFVVYHLWECIRYLLPLIKLSPGITQILLGSTVCFHMELAKPIWFCQGAVFILMPSNIHQVIRYQGVLDNMSYS